MVKRRQEGISLGKKAAKKRILRLERSITLRGTTLSGDDILYKSLMDSLMKNWLN